MKKKLTKEQKKKTLESLPKIKETKGVTDLYTLNLQVGFNQCLLEVKKIIENL